MGRDLRLQRREARAGRRQGIVAEVLVRKIDGRLGMGHRLHEARAPAVIEAMQPAFHLGERLAALGLGLGRHQVGDAFRLREVEAAGLEGAPGELAGLGGAEPRRRCERVRERGDDRGAAMDVELRDILAGGAGGAWKPERQSPVDRLTRIRLAEAARRGAARRRQRRPADPRQRLCRRGARDADHRDGGPPAAAGEGEDGAAAHGLGMPAVVVPAAAVPAAGRRIGLRGRRRPPPRPARLPRPPRRGAAGPASA